MNPQAPRNNVNLQVHVPVWRDVSTRGRCLEYLDLCLDLLKHRWPDSRGCTDEFEAACDILGRAMQFDDNKLFALRLAARYRAIGMLGLADAAPLQDTAIHAHPELARQYTTLGVRLVHKAFPDFPDAMGGIWYQHERPDGTGPYRLCAHEIPDIAGIIALIHAIELMRGGAPSCENIVATIQIGIGTQFNPAVVGAFKRTATQVFRALGLSGTTQLDSPESAAVSREPESLESLRPLIDPERLNTLIDKRLRVRPFSDAIQNVMRITAYEHCSIGDIGDALMRDPALSIRILTLANSSAYSRGQQVSTVKDAVMRIGIREVRSVLMTLDVLEHFRGAVSEHLDAHLFCEHLIATGLFAAALTRECSAPQADDYMLWGMLHDVGRLILIESLPKQYAKALQAAEQLNVPLHTVESKLLHCDHCDIGRQALEHWGFPKGFAIPIANHHRSLNDVRELPLEQARAAATISLANRLSHAHVLGQSGNDMIQPIDKLVDFLGIDPGRIADLATLVCKETQSLEYAMLSRTGSAARPDAIDTHRKQTETGVIPLCVSANSQVDAYRMFFERLV